MKCSFLKCSPGVFFTILHDTADSVHIQAVLLPTSVRQRLFHNRGPGTSISDLSYPVFGIFPLLVPCRAFECMFARPQGADPYCVSERPSDLIWFLDGIRIGSSGGGIYCLWIVLLENPGNGIMSRLGLWDWWQPISFSQIKNCFFGMPLYYLLIFWKGFWDPRASFWWSSSFPSKAEENIIPES